MRVPGGPVEPVQLGAVAASWGAFGSIANIRESRLQNHCVDQSTESRMTGCIGILYSDSESMDLTPFLILVPPVYRTHASAAGYSCTYDHMCTPTRESHCGGLSRLTYACNVRVPPRARRGASPARPRRGGRARRGSVDEQRRAEC
eukprot:COSAG02_NODE_2772_length_8058_cov_64.441513_6_plen_146_part_00